MLAGSSADIMWKLNNEYIIQHIGDNTEVTKVAGLHRTTNNFIWKKKSVYLQCVCVGGGGGGEGEVTSYIWHSADVRAEWPPFQRCQVYD